ncbi:TetR/AcrR family transcriptional regulator [Herbiconiux ginsengi]|uniref:TetR/AcrR family transcriptional regulator n=1 Tax=Herbiconiux ginsengi TaxID=381665 RepID=UPI000B823C56
MIAARELFTAHGVGGVTTQQVADRADVAVGTLFLYASTNAELMIMVQNGKFEAAIEKGLAAAATAENDGEDVLATVLALLRPVVACIREHVENGRAYLHELLFGDPMERDLSVRLEQGTGRLLARDPYLGYPVRRRWPGQYDRNPPPGAQPRRRPR